MAVSTIIESHYFPSVAFFTQLVNKPSIIIEACENYSKGSYRNRCHIAGANGLQRLSVPLKKGKNSQQAIQEVKISYDTNWQHEHWLGIKSAYGKAPFFEFYADGIELFYKKKYETLFELNQTILEHLIQTLGLNIELQLSVEFHKIVDDSVKDLRNTIKPNSTDFPNFELVEYPQAFLEKHGFLSNLSILDLLFCTGPQAILILEQSYKN